MPFSITKENTNILRYEIDVHGYQFFCYVYAHRLRMTAIGVILILPCEVRMVTDPELSLELNFSDNYCFHYFYYKSNDLYRE